MNGVIKNNNNNNNNNSDATVHEIFLGEDQDFTPFTLSTLLLHQECTVRVEYLLY